MKKRDDFYNMIKDKSFNYKIYGSKKKGYFVWIDNQKIKLTGDILVQAREVLEMKKRDDFYNMIKDKSFNYKIYGSKKKGYYVYIDNQKVKLTGYILEQAELEIADYALQLWKIGAWEELYKIGAIKEIPK